MPGQRSAHRAGPDVASPAKLAIMIPPVSVCHQLSWIGRPSASTPHTHRLGVERLADARDEPQRGEVVLAGRASAPTRIIMRTAVGAVYQTVTRSSLEHRVPAVGVELAPRRRRCVTPIVSGAMMPYDVPVTQPGSAVHQ